MPSIAFDRNAIDLIIPTRRPAAFGIELLQEAARSRDWMRHHFIFVFDADQQAAERRLKEWVQTHHSNMALPQVTTCFAPAASKGNLSALRQQGLNLGKNPFVYFQDDDDPLPTGLNRRVTLMQNEDWDAVYGVTETYSSRGLLIERFPTLDSHGNYLYNVARGMQLFPTYAHPLAALFRRRVFDATPYADGNRYTLADSGSFVTRLLTAKGKMTALPDRIRVARQHTDNVSAPIMDEAQATALAADIANWLPTLKDETILAFQQNIHDELLAGTITTFRDIDARIEEALELED